MIINDILTFKITTQINTSNNDDEPCSINECQQRIDWPIWRAAIQTKHYSVNKYGVFGPIELTSKVIQPVNRYS